MAKVRIIGASHTPFSMFAEKNRETGEITDTKPLHELIVEAGRGAIADAGLTAADIDAVWVGACSPGSFVKQEHVAPLAVGIDPVAMRYKPMTRTECACASGSVALYDAMYAIEASRYRRVLVIGVEKMSTQSTAMVTDILARCSFWPEEGALGMTFPGLFAEMAKAYRARFGVSAHRLRTMLAHVTARSYEHGALNPLAQFGPGGLPTQKGLLTADAILSLPEEGKGANVMIADPLRLHDCSPISDGAAAVVLCARDAVPRSQSSVEIAGVGHCEERMPIGDRREELHELRGARAAATRAYREAGITAGDLHLAEVHDCFTINQLLCTEALGLAATGSAGDAYLDGRFGPDDECAINLSGGLKAKGHPVGATGVSMHALLYKQLLGKAIGRAPSKQPHVAATMNIGGAGVTNCVTVLRRVS
jgi:acetyl-CoA C-acetyltransferase